MDVSGRMRRCLDPPESTQSVTWAAPIMLAFVVFPGSRGYLSEKAICGARTVHVAGKQANESILDLIKPIFQSA